MARNHANYANQAERDYGRSSSARARASAVEWLAAIAERLERIRFATDDALGRAVVGCGSCVEVQPDGDRPGWLFDNQTDRDVAARICARCPVQDECLELELRLFGAQRLGMWGVLGEDDRCALHPIWTARREPADARDVGGGDR